MISPFSSGLRYSPYNWNVTQERAFTNNSGASITTQIRGNPTKITLKFDVSKQSATVPSKVAYRIDDREWVIVPITATVDVPIPEALSNWTVHNLEIVLSTTSESVLRWVEPVPSAMRFLGIDTVPATCVAVKPPAKPLNGLVYGDSITEGINTVNKGGDSTNRSDALQSWAFQLGDEIGAEIGVVGFGLLGMSRTANGGVPKLPESWRNISAMVTRDFTPEPDFIVINLGTNDKNGNIPIPTFTSDYISTLNSMLDAMSNTKMFVMVPFGGHYGVMTYQDIVLGVSDPARVFLVDTTGWWDTADATDGIHPWGYTAPKHAKLLATEVSSRLTGSTSFSLEKIYDGLSWR